MCVHKAAEKKSIKEFGCTTPFGPNKNQICTDPEIGNKALTLYKGISIINDTVFINGTSTRGWFPIQIEAQIR